MARSDKTSGSYWDLLKQARRHLDEGDFPSAERLYTRACDRREQSPGRVFLTEKLTDGLGRLFRRSDTGDTAGKDAGRWQRHVDDFRRRFLEDGDRTVRQAVRTAELRPEDDANKNQPLLERALFLVGRSVLFSEEPASAVPLLKGLFRTARRTGRPFSVDLVRHDLPLTEEDRLWLARRGGELVVEFQEQGALEAGSRETEEWARVCLQLLNPRYFGQTGRLEEERCWIEAVTADHLLGRAAESVDAYRQYLGDYPEPGERADEARVRLLELLGNIDDLHFQVPDYDRALAAMQSAGLSVGSAMAGRFEAALARIEYRRPDPEPGPGREAAWASLDLESDGRVAVVFWWRDQPRDVAYWRPGEDSAALMNFLEPCADRLLAGSDAAITAVRGVWPEAPPVWSVRDFAAALLEPLLPPAGLEGESLLRLAMGETAPWRSGWNPDHGHMHLEPPRRSSLVEAWQGGPAGAALVAGLLLLAVRSRLAMADPCLRAGLRHLARRGNAAAAIVYELVAAGSAETDAVDSAFQPWTLPLLWTRPDPFGWAAEGAAAVETRTPAAETLARPDLGRNDLAIVATGDPAAVVAAWGDGRQKWRIVLDRLDRLESLSRVAGGAIGPVTLIPPSGRIHDLQAALDWLESMLGDEAAADDPLLGLLPLFHWVRLVETHNGDLLDFQQVRPRPDVSIPLYESYARAVNDLATDEPRLQEEEGARESWATQFSQRVRKAGFVAGLVDSLPDSSERLDSLWGVFEGSDASWVFLDSAAVHWSLLGREGAAVHDLHDLLHSRGHRHLSLLTGAVWLRTELEDLLSAWLQVYGAPYRVGLTDRRPPRLRLADRGLVPDSALAPLEALAAPWSHARRRLTEAGGGTILLPREGTPAAFWRDVAGGRLGSRDEAWFFLANGGAENGPALRPENVPSEGRRLLLIPVLRSLEGGEVPIALEDTPAAWAGADRDRWEFLEWRRRLCGLEIAAHLAGPWEEVEILDPRWWRLLKPDTVTAEPGTVWTGALAAAEVSGETCPTFDLPGAGSGREMARTVLETVRAWLDENPRPEAAGPDAPRAVPAPVALPSPGKPVLVCAGGEDYWRHLVHTVRRQWEAGDLSAWILLVSETMPADATGLVAGSWAPGMSAWPLEDGPRAPAPVLWLQQGDFANPALQEFLQRRPPTYILACGLQGWLPLAADGSPVTAQALRVLLDRTESSIVLETAPLPGPWWEFLKDATGAQAPVPGHAPDHDPTEFPGDAEALGRLRNLLERLDEILPKVSNEGRSAVSARQLVSLRWLGRLAGVPEETIRHGVRILRWVGRLAGERLTAGVGPGEAGAGRRLTHALIIPERFAVLESELLRLENHLPVLLPLLLGGARPGLSIWVDLAYPPVETEVTDLLRLDAYLAMVADRGTPALRWQARRGFMHSPRRLLSLEGSAADVLREMVDGLVLFRQRLRDLMAGAVETGDGFLIDTGLTDLRDEERDFLGTGAAMGLWRWLGPVDADSLHLVDLLTLAESPTVRRQDLAWDLLQHLVGPVTREDLEGETREAAEGSRSGGWRRGVLRPFWKGGERADVFDSAVRQVASLAGSDRARGTLILRGAVGTGRHEALGRGLARAGNRGEITIYCPDDEAAANLLEAAGPRLAAHLLDIRIPRSGSTPPMPLDLTGHLADTGDNVVLMCEVQRFEKETRYRIAQTGLGRKLLMTVDDRATGEPWENLFLTTPRSSEILTLENSRRHTREVWDAVQGLDPDREGDGGAVLRTDHGSILADYAVNLDQCLARLVADVEDGSLPDRLRLVGPLLSDLDFLADSVRRRGWLALPEQTLAGLKMPGVRELLAVATDLLAQNMVAEAEDADRNTAQSDTPTGGDAPGSGTGGGAPAFLTRHMLPRAALAGWESWRQAFRHSPADLTFAQFHAEVETTEWARTFLAHPAAGPRIGRLLEEWADESVALLADTPLWEAWWLSTLADLRLPLPRERRPLVTLAEAGRTAGLFAPGCLYLCLGSESWQRHYGVLARCTDRALILYKECSPLRSEEDGPHD